MIEIQKPRIECVDVVDGREMKFVVEPLERGFGTTIGNALRRILLSALPGAAPVSIKIEGVRHEFSSIPGIKEDVTEIILNIKGLAVKAHSDSLEFRQVAKLRKSTAGVVTAADIEHSSEIEILNPDMYICTLDEGAVLNMDITIGNGRGYVPAAANKDETQPIGYIPIDSIFTPVESASYTVESTRLGQNINYDKLTVNVSTNGTSTPREVISLAAKILEDHISLFVNLVDTMKDREILISQDDEKAHKKLEMSIEDLDLSVRSYNCLKRAGIHTVQDLTKKTEEEMLKVRNLGKKSLDEVIKKIRDLGFDLRSKDE
ncbi:MAG TPA: DNA-directed RNA polymerase subunit alpha [Candidatus Ornithoclostridium faecigallinarum]|nr:DNA-directed RNA polymerase subunit alpha [Candidatus Ornithoclostridium faecigallinarum]